MPTGRFSPYPVHTDPETGERVKFCPGCQRDRSEAAFRTRTGTRSLESRCRECKAAAQRARWANTPQDERDRLNREHTERLRRRQLRQRLQERYGNRHVGITAS